VRKIVFTIALVLAMSSTSLGLMPDAFAVPPGQQVVQKVRAKKGLFSRLRLRLQRVRPSARAMGGRLLHSLRHPIRTGRELRAASVARTQLREKALDAATPAGQRSIRFVPAEAGGNLFGLMMLVPGPVSLVGSIGLGINGTTELITSKSAEGRLNGSHKLAWSAQLMSGAGLVAGHGWVRSASAKLGIAGGAIQTAIGGYRIFSGIRNKNRSRTFLGALDLGAGTCWMATACGIGGMAAVGGFAAFTAGIAGHWAYNNRGRIKGFLADLGHRLKGSKAVEERTHVLVSEDGVSEHVARSAAANNEGSTIVSDGQGNARAVVTEGAIQQADGSHEPAVVLTPIEPPSSNSAAVE
jgi:hypothetical protein